jgi:hypothetical protein
VKQILCKPSFTGERQREPKNIPVEIAFKKLIFSHGNMQERKKLAISDYDRTCCIR